MHRYLFLCILLYAGCWLLAFGCRLLAAACCLLRAACCLLPAACCLLPAAAAAADAAAAAGFLMYSFTRTRPPHQIFNVLFYPDAPSAPDLNCILLPGRALRTGFFMYSCVFILMYSFTRTRHPHQICYVFLCINSYVFLRILMYSYVLCIL